MGNYLLETKNLKKYFKVGHGLLHAIDNLNLGIYEGQTMGLVGESGCGKSTVGRVILRLLKETSGEVYYKGENILKLNAHQMKMTRRDMQIIFQDPYSSLNPRMTVSEIIREVLIVNKFKASKKEMNEKVKELMDRVGLDQRLINTFPHELDGGRRQRIGIARALALNPKFIVCDEPVSALDVSIQAQILNLLMDLQENEGMTYLFISHDLSVVKHISQEIAVMYLGHCVERTQSDEIFEKPLHPYTQDLLRAIPLPDITKRKMPIELIRGEVTSPIDPPPGCRFVSRCKFAKKECTEHDIPLIEVSKGHFVSCILCQ
jgi:peptide/nickel transport system ATP-binding protein